MNFVIQSTSCSVYFPRTFAASEACELLLHWVSYFFPRLSIRIPFLLFVYCKFHTSSLAKLFVCSVLTFESIIHARSRCSSCFFKVKVSNETPDERESQRDADAQVQSILSGFLCLKVSSEEREEKIKIFKLKPVSRVLGWVGGSRCIWCINSGGEFELKCKITIQSVKTSLLLTRRAKNRGRPNKTWAKTGQESRGCRARRDDWMKSRVGVMRMEGGKRETRASTIHIIPCKTKDRTEGEYILLSTVRSLAGRERECETSRRMRRGRERMKDRRGASDVRIWKNFFLVTCKVDSL